MNSPFDTERPLIISPSLAATIGLEEACLLAVLTELAEFRAPDNSRYWLFNETDAQRRLPFWTPLDLERISKSLSAKGLLHIGSAPFQQGMQLLFSFAEYSTHAPAQNTGQYNQVASPQPGYQNPAANRGLPIVSAASPGSSFGAYQQTTNTPVASSIAQPHGATLIAPHWQPDQDTIARLAQLNVDEQFARQQIPEFVTFWRESGESHRSWGAKFHQQVIRKWRERETFTHTRDQMLPIDFGWRPSPEAMEMMTKHAGITPQFVEDAIAEFILYWHEKGTTANTWNTKFIQHVRRQWARFQSTIEHDATPKIISEAWRPGADVFDILRLANIDTDFAQQLIPEFILYWKETKQAQSSWNTKFLQHIKYHWAQRHKINVPQSSNNGANNSGQSHTRNTRDRSLAEDLTDTSW